MKFERQLVWPCGDCAVRGSSFCSTLIDRPPSSPSLEQGHISQLFLSASKDEVIGYDEHDGKYFSGPLVLCKGWAYRFYRFPDGRRQILSVLIPGDMFSASALLDPHPDFSVQAATDVQVCQLSRDDIKRILAAEPGVCDAFGKLCAAELDESTSAVIDLNDSNKVTRIVGFIKRLVKRLSARGIRNRAEVYPFPLTHTDIADATGLTPGDINCAINELREHAIVNMSDGLLIVLDREKLETVR